MFFTSKGSLPVMKLVKINIGGVRGDAALVSITARGKWVALISYIDTSSIDRNY